MDLHPVYPPWKHVFQPIARKRCDLEPYQLESYASRPKQLPGQKSGSTVGGGDLPLMLYKKFNNTNNTRQPWI